MEIKFCTAGGCYEVAVRAPRCLDLCREHYVAELAADGPALTTSLADVPLVRAEVVGPVPITDARTCCGVVPGQMVELDPTEVNIAALVYSGHIKVEPAKTLQAAADKDS